ncbi:MAG: Glycosyl transferase group 1 [Candidatus Uhrbacteria bacterium GW2011_GWA2_52_8d]|uniref:Glycosyl transferase group 1 n=1 Tax=Candidatus Uhrbacteria bacterium GW2011_GWA2_52_8d TaxID=1618979 RepID=A0A0G1ZU65_9BACT|nr:MAG: Glycosyl transferase group 1 [Candidatus Uhrbacteria bacterium GW2011_GWA2_52_8d]
MRIGVDIRALLDRPLTGVGEYTFQLLDALLRDGHDDTYVLFSNSFHDRPVLPDAWPRDRFTLRTFRIPNKLLNLSLVLARRPRLDRMLAPIDCFFAPNLHFLPLTRETPFLLTVHDLSFHHYRSLFSLRRRLWHRLLMPERLFARADVLLAVSQATADDLHKTYHIPNEKIAMIHSGIHIVRTSEDAQARVRTQYRLPEHFLLSLSTLEPRKNLLAVLDAYEQLRARFGYRGGLVIAGAPGWSRGAFHRALATHPYRADIQVLPYVAPEEKYALFALADVFLYLSVYEGFGFPPLEAAMQGTPVLAGHHSSLSEVMDDAAILVDVHNIADIAHGVAAVLHDAPLRSRLAAAGARVSARYSWKKTAALTRAAFYASRGSHAHRH